MLRICVLLLCSLSAFAEESPAFVQFRSRAMQGPMVLRDFGTEKSREYVWGAGKLTGDAVRLHEFAGFRANKVSLHGKTIQMEGTRAFLVKDASSGAVVPHGLEQPMKLRLKIDDANVDSGLQAATAAMFFANFDDAVKAVPETMKVQVPAVFDSKTDAYVTCKDCGVDSVMGTETIYKISEKTGVLPPKLTHQVDPDFRQSHFNGLPRKVEALYGMVLGADGVPKQFWLVKPIGTDLDFDGYEAVSQYRFAPSTKDGKPVSVRLNVAVAFQLMDK